MGCCFSCKDDEDNQGDSIDRQQLLRDPVSNATHHVASSSNDVKTIHAEGQQEDELAKILQETASAMIDVSGSGSHSLDQREFQERSRHYLSMIQNLPPTLIRPTPAIMLADHPHPERFLGLGLVSSEDLNLMKWAIAEVQEGLRSIRVEHEEDLVVPFGGKDQVIVSSPTPST